MVNSKVDYQRRIALHGARPHVDEQTTDDHLTSPPLLAPCQLLESRDYSSGMIRPQRATSETMHGSRRFVVEPNQA